MYKKSILEQWTDLQAENHTTCPFLFSGIILTYINIITNIDRR